MYRAKISCVYLARIPVQKYYEMYRGMMEAWLYYPFHSCKEFVMLRSKSFPLTVFYERRGMYQQGLIQRILCVQLHTECATLKNLCRYNEKKLYNSKV